MPPTLFNPEKAPGSGPWQSYFLFNGPMGRPADQSTPLNLAWLYTKVAHCHFSLDEFEKSLLMTLEALHRQPRGKLEKAELRSYLTTNYYELGRYREAVVEGEKTLELARRFPNDDVFYFRMALAHYKLGERKAFAKYRGICRKLFKDDSWNKYLEKLK